ncbi:hypothetical protein EV359DRAFT_60921 [Lentinula novae-zelandiae]|nr:hypothetical protein EV359DRAFT_60921 [Lentinula novae-zelandiae]
MPRQPGNGKPKPYILTIAGQVLTNGNNSGMIGNYNSSKEVPKSGKRTALLGRPYVGELGSDWDIAINNLKHIIGQLTKGDGHDVAYLWQDDDADLNDGSLRFGAPLFCPLKAGEAKDGSIPSVVPKGKENTTFWKDAINFFAFTQFPAFDNQGNRIENHDVQAAIEGATVALDIVIRGWKFKADKKWGLALDLKRLSIIAPPEDEPEPELPPLPGSQGSTASNGTTAVEIEGTMLPASSELGKEGNAGNLARLPKKRDGSPLNGRGQTKLAKTSKNCRSMNLSGLQFVSYQTLPQWLLKYQEQHLVHLSLFMASLRDINIDLLFELISYLSAADLANLAQTTKHYGSVFFPPVRLRPQELRLVGPFIDKHERRSLSIIRALVSSNLHSLTLCFPAFHYQPNEYTIAKMLRQIIPALHNLHVFKLCLNTPLKEVKQWRADGTPRANTLANIFNDNLFTLPLLQAFSFEELTYHCSVFDLNPIPDIAIGGSLRLLTHFKGSLANVNALMTRWDHNLISVSVVGGPSSVDSVDCFRHNIEGSMTLWDLKLHEDVRVVWVLVTLR